MSRIQRIPTKQGHPIPHTAMPTQGPFPRELYMSLPVITEYEGISGNGGPEVPFGSTAQNDFRPLKWVRCTECLEVLKEDQTSSHECAPRGESFYNMYDVDDDDDFYDEDDDFEDGRTY